MQITLLQPVGIINSLMQLLTLFILHYSKLCTIKAWLVFDLVAGLRGCGVSVACFLESGVNHAVDKEAPDKAKDDSAGKQEVEDGDLYFSNVKWEH